MNSNRARLAVDAMGGDFGPSVVVPGALQGARETGSKVILVGIEEEIRKKGDLAGSMASQGTTPRRLTDLIGSLCDLTSGSGDKGTPIIHIQGYFDNYTN